MFEPHFDADPSLPIPVLFENEELLIVDKPSGFFVHPPEDKIRKVPREFIALFRLEDQVKTKLYPLHRLDVGTSGCLAFAKSSASAQKHSPQFSENQWEKSYVTVCRGYFSDGHTCEIPLELDSTGDLVNAVTEFKKIAQVEVNQPVGKKFSTARYSILSAVPRTGRYHQIRRHLNRLSHPMIGDRYHGDSHHNRFFRETLQIPGLLLRATSLKIGDVSVIAPKNPRWEQIKDLFGIDRFDLHREQ
ncbi:MAG: pseudouridine synthase [Proteobacteria bacterium]|jgi:tRNA pseudouridine65 synthase|nr:pseudouridine synthase [Pseudomonadota bacterium]